MIRVVLLNYLSRDTTLFLKRPFNNGGYLYRLMIALTRESSRLNSIDLIL